MRKNVVEKLGDTIYPYFDPRGYVSLLILYSVVMFIYTLFIEPVLLALGFIDKRRFY